MPCVWLFFLSPDSQSCPAPDVIPVQDCVGPRRQCTVVLLWSSALAHLSQGNCHLSMHKLATNVHPVSSSLLCPLGSTVAILVDYKCVPLHFLNLVVACYFQFWI